MRITALSALALGFGLLSAQLAACSNSAGDCEATASCGNGSTAGSSTTAGSSGDTTDGGSGSSGGSSGGKSGSSSGSGSGSGTTGAAGAGGGGGNGACEGDVSDDASCWATDELGVFVSSEHGDDATADGTKDFPYKTLAKGISSANGKNIYVCVGTDDYAERVSLDHPASEVRIYGGFECQTWTYDTARRAQVISPSNIALRLQSITAGVYIENMEFVAADGSGSDASSYGAFITDSKNVTFKRVKLSAGKGLKGADGMPGANGEDGAKVPSDDLAPQKGKAADCTSPAATQEGGAWEAPAAYGALGGAGGKGRLDAGLAGGNGDPGTPTNNVEAGNSDNGGVGATAPGADGGMGSKGANGLSGDRGEPAPGAGSFSETGFAPADGLSGKKGYPGQGGGGGGASKGNGTCLGASGGAGGMGGDAGLPGNGGRGGGASVGLFSWSSNINLLDSEILAKQGGAGGAGGAGGEHGQGANGAAGGDGSGQVAAGGIGGRGGVGGDGGSGSGGTGGPSVAIAYFGTEPSFDSNGTNLGHGDGGDAGMGGTLFDVDAPEGSVGASLALFEIM